MSFFESIFKKSATEAEAAVPAARSVEEKAKSEAEKVEEKVAEEAKVAAAKVEEAVVEPVAEHATKGGFLPAGLSKWTRAKKQQAKETLNMGSASRDPEFEVLVSRVRVLRSELEKIESSAASFVQSIIHYSSASRSLGLALKNCVSDDRRVGQHKSVLEAPLPTGTPAELKSAANQIFSAVGEAATAIAGALDLNQAGNVATFARELNDGATKRFEVVYEPSSGVTDMLPIPGVLGGGGPKKPPTQWNVRATAVIAQAKQWRHYLEKNLKAKETALEALRVEYDWYREKLDKAEHEQHKDPSAHTRANEKFEASKVKYETHLNAVKKEMVIITEHIPFIVGPIVAQLYSLEDVLPLGQAIDSQIKTVAGYKFFAPEDLAAAEKASN